ncbi:MAG TPA: DUF935 family protein [Chryseolinea sp.]|nr:DUF935 family protein [Chryseolinea sp.]
MAEDKLSDKLDIYYDRSRKTIQAWVSAHIRAELQRINGQIQVPIKKPLQDIYDSILLDPHLSSVIQQRKSKVLGEEFAVMDDRGNIDDELTKLFSKQWFNKLQEAIIDSKFYGYSLVEIQELIDSEIKDVKLISRGNVIPELRSIVKNPYQVNLGQLIPIDGRNDSDYYILVDSQNLGILNSVVVHALIKRITIAMWGDHAQTFGIPMTVLKTDNRDQTAKYQADMQRLITNRNIVTGLSDELEIIATSSTDAHKIYSELINLCNSEMSKAVLSVTMTTDDGSSRSQSEVHERVADEVSDSDREYMTYIINDIVFPKLIALGYRLENSHFKFISKEKRSYQERLDTINQLTLSGYQAEGEDIKQYLDLPFDVELMPTQQSVPDNGFQKKSPNQSGQLLAELKEYYKHHDNCSHDIINSVESEVDDLYNRELESIVDQIISDVYSNNVNPLDPEYIRRVGDLMSKAVFDSFNFDGDLSNPNFDSEDLDFIAALKQNIYYFTGGKNKALVQSFNDLLFEGKNLRSFSQFKQECKKIGLEFNKNHLKTEYQSAISQAQSASDWLSYDNDDMLMFSTVGDARVRPSHAKLEGLILKKNDSLFNSLVPPFDWNCRCRLVAVPNAKPAKLTAKERSEYKKIAAPDFRFNPGKTGELFSKNHPYLKILSKEDKKEIDGLL